jgi:hypothetical protein
LEEHDLIYQYLQFLCIAHQQISLLFHQGDYIEDMVADVAQDISLDMKTLTR